VVGEFYKLRAVYRQTQYGPRLDIRKIRRVNDGDRDAGFDPDACLPRSRFSPEGMWHEVLELAEKHIADEKLRRLVEMIFEEHRETILRRPAARRNHHACVGGLLEHTLSVAKTALFLAEKYAEYYPRMHPPLDKGLVVAGAILHDIGKIHELEQTSAGTVYTPRGRLIGHLLLGRDLVLQQAAELGLASETALRLEHLIIAHQRLPEWGSPKPPMTPEALLVHYADDIDAKFHMMVEILENDQTPGPLTGERNILGHGIYRGTLQDP
jgi:3'-5' exoribonuclease